MSLCEQLIGGTNLGAKQKSIIDRCTASVYRSYQPNDYQGHIPVSYTHLIFQFRVELSAVGDNHIFADNILTVVNAVLVVNVLNTERNKSVSYTHLDVYKRQLLKSIDREASRRNGQFATFFYFYG